MAREGIGLVGAAVGAYFGGPVGAQIGFAVGSAIGGYIDPTVVPAPSLGEAPIQTGRDGVPLPIVWGLCHMHGNIIQTGPIDEVTTKKRQGKGSSTKVEETRRYRTFAIGICRGPIESVTRIWENDRLVYDDRGVDSVVDAADHADYAASINIHLGTDDQLADTDLEAITGIGNQPYYRDNAYCVWPNWDITDTASAIPQFRFEVNGSKDLSVTSKPYAIVVIDEATAGLDHANQIIWNVPVEKIECDFTLINASLNSIVEEYTDWPPEGVDAAFTFDSGSITKIVQRYEDWPPEGIDADLTLVSADLTVIVVRYTNQPIAQPEGIDAAFTLISGNMI